MRDNAVLIIKFLLVLGLTMWAFISIVPEERTDPAENYHYLFSEEEVYGHKH